MSEPWTVEITQYKEDGETDVFNLYDYEDMKSEKCRKCGKVIKGRGVDVEVGSYTRVYTICIDCAMKLEEWIKSKGN